MRNATRITVVAFAFSMLSSGGVLCQTNHDHPSASAHTKAVRRELTGIRHFGEVTPKLYRGGQPSEGAMAALKKIGVKIVVDMRGRHNDPEEAALRKLGMQYISIPSHCPFPTDRPYIRFLKVIEENPDKKIFVHCRLGDDRTGMAVAAYRIADEGWTPEEAMNEMREFGFSTVHHAICPLMAHYESVFPEHLKKNPEFKGLRTYEDKSK